MKEINIAEVLKNKPRGIKLYSLSLENAHLVLYKV